MAGHRGLAGCGKFAGSGRKAIPQGLRPNSPSALCGPTESRALIQNLVLTQTLKAVHYDRNEFCQQPVSARGQCETSEIWEIRSRAGCPGPCDSIESYRFSKIRLVQPSGWPPLRRGREMHKVCALCALGLLSTPRSGGLPGVKRLQGSLPGFGLAIPLQIMRKNRNKLNKVRFGPVLTLLGCIDSDWPYFD